MLDVQARQRRRLVFFTDLDGTLLDRDTYSWAAAEPALAEVRRLRIPLVLVTSKTKAEVDDLRSQLRNTDPYVVENGAITVVPEDYFGPQVAAVRPPVAREQIQATLADLRQEHGFSFKGFAEMGEEGISRHTGLGIADAKAANARLASEPILWTDTAARYDDFVKLVTKRGLHCVMGGRFVQVSGLCDKGAAVADLIDKFRAQSAERLLTVALGDAPNDIAMLEEADIAVIVRSEHHSPQLADETKPLYRTTLQGPSGWCEAVLDILNGWPNTAAGE